MHQSLRRCSPGVRRRVLAVVLVGGVLFGNRAVADEPVRSAVPNEAARRSAERIRGEALLPANGPAGRPLPLVSHWNMGSQGKGWTPQYQVELLEKGHHILPWMGWPRGDPGKDEKAGARFDDYYAELLAYCRALALPISFRGTQWEAMLVRQPYRELPAERCPAVITPDGRAIAKLSPFGPVDAWRHPAGEYVDTPAMKRVQRIYPDPPLVLFVSNNEAPDLRWHRVDVPAKYRDVRRWFLLDTDLDAPRPWEQTTDVPVFSMALVRGETGGRTWLVYAHSPLAERRNVQITLPGYGRLGADVPREGAFYVVDERQREVTRVDLQ